MAANAVIATSAVAAVQPYTEQPFAFAAITAAIEAAIKATIGSIVVSVAAPRRARMQVRL
jgi:hypothetical protein